MIYFYTNPTDRVWADSALKILHFQRQMFLVGFPSLKKEEGKNYSFYRTHLQKDKTEGPLFFCGSSLPAKTGGINTMGKLRHMPTFFNTARESDCECCVHSIRKEGQAFCSAHRVMGTPGCRRFRYDPLKRTPRNLPPLREYDPEDFKL